MIIAYNHNMSAIYRGFGRFARHDRRGPGALEDRQQSGLFWLLQTIAKLNTSAGVVVFSGSGLFGRGLAFIRFKGAGAVRHCSAWLRFGCCFVTAGGRAAAAGALAGDTLI